MKPTLIVDSSVIVKWLNQTKEENLEQADEIINEAVAGKVKLFTPELAKYEVGNVLIKKGVTPTNVVSLFSILYSLPITFIAESSEIAKDTFSLAYELGITYYDASFLAVAKQYDATLVTENVKHQGKSSEVKVVALKDY